MKKKVYQNDGNGNVVEVEIETNEPIYVTKKQMFERLKILGKDEVVWNALTTSQQLEFTNLEQGIATNDAMVSALLTACGVNPEEVLY